jgi:hypothetical protein
MTLLIDSIIYFLKKEVVTLPNYFLVLVLNLVITFVLFDWTRIEVCYISFSLQNSPRPCCLSSRQEFVCSTICIYWCHFLYFSYLLIYSRAVQAIYLGCFILFFLLEAKLITILIRKTLLIIWNVSLKGVVAQDWCHFNWVVSWLSLKFASIMEHPEK